MGWLCKMMRRESAVELHSAALHAAASLMNALKTQNLLQEDDSVSFVRLVLQFAEGRTEPRRIFFLWKSEVKEKL